MNEWHDAASLKLFPEELPPGRYPPGSRAYWFKVAKAVYDLHVTHVVRDDDGNAKFVNEDTTHTAGIFRRLKEGDQPEVSHIVVLPGGYVDPSFLE
jgi:hypothetical protein